MSRTLEYSGLVMDGKLPLAVSSQIASVIRSMEGKRIVIGIKELKRRRSNSANAYLWGCVYPAIVQVFREAGNNVDAEDVHAYCKDHVGKLKQVFVKADGEVLIGPGSTAKLTTSEFQEYLARLKMWAADVLDLRIPEPGEYVNQPTERSEEHEVSG